MLPIQLVNFNLPIGEGVSDNGKKISGEVTMQEYFQSALSMLDQLWKLMLTDPAVSVEVIIALWALAKANEVLQEGRKLEPMLRSTEQRIIGFLPLFWKNPQPPQPPPQPIAVPAHNYWYRLIAGAIYFSIAVLSFWLASRGGWF